VWYTPEPVVNFIVRAVDDVLKTEFGLADGLADTSKVTVDWDTGTSKNGKAVTIIKEVHRVQILDPAAGTGTFLAEVIKQIAPKVKDVAEGQWSNYVEKELIPRLHGFELLMASYAMCHMKLDMMLTEMGYKPTANPPRMGVYLTNSLEEGDREIQDLFWAKPLSEEAKQANTIKRDMPIMCVIGNPPYSGESANKGDWIMGLMEAYKKEPGGKEKLKERNPKWINDDYVKFIRFAEHLIEKNGEGVLGFITNHGYLDNPTFRGMRWHLLKTFDKIWVLDLHGNAKKKEVSPDGTPDKNVFDIMQGVAIIIATKKDQKKSDKVKLGEVYHGELWGDRKAKQDILWRHIKAELSPTLLLNNAPSYVFITRDNSRESKYSIGFNLQELMPENSLGTLTKRDRLVIDFTEAELRDKLARFSDQSISDQQAAKLFDLKMEDKDSWNLTKARKALQTTNNQGFVQKEWFRPFEKRWIAYHELLIARRNVRIFKNFGSDSNIGLVAVRQLANLPFVHAFVCDSMADQHYISTRTKEGGVVFPLYLYPDEQSLDQTRRVNFDPKIRKAIEAAATDASRPAARAPQHEGKLKFPDEVAIFDYIYGVLHCPAYRETYKEFLKIDFPRVPYPASPDVFWEVSAKGTQLRKLHLMEDAAIGPAPYKFVGEGDSKVVKVEFRVGSPLSVGSADISPSRGENEKSEMGAVYINAAQSFENVPRVAWEFYIGGYQPAQKWLKDRKGRELSFDDIKHYQKIIKILSETDRIMKTIIMQL
jgi:predicted helicase